MSPSSRPGKRTLWAAGGFAPAHWVGGLPNGAGRIKPDHFGEIFRTAWQNRDQLPYAWRILTRGVCDGCALGTSGLADYTMPGVHLCTVRLNLLRMNTMKAMDPGRLADVRPLAASSGRALRELGRLAHPMVRRRGEPGFFPISWDEALERIADRLGPILARDPNRFACYVTSRGVTNETYYAVQKAVRALGTNNVDNSARLCHAPSTSVLKSMLGATGSTCSYVDWIGTDLLVFLGSDVANNQPVATKYIYYAKHHGTKVALVNPYREPGMEGYWIPSVLESAVFGTKLTDEHFSVHSGGDAAFLNGVLKALLARGGIDRTWIDAHTTGFDALEAELARQSFDDLEAISGATRSDMERFATLYAGARSAVFVWSMGLTQHETGPDNVRALVNLALARGMVGREHTGLMPIRGHSGVQGGSEVGCIPNGLPGGRGLDSDARREMHALWGFEPPEERGLDARAMIDAAFDHRLDALFAIGGNFLDTLPDPLRVAAALGRLPLRIHQDLVVTSQMLVEPGEEVFLLPARTRYEQTGGGTETSTERRILMSPEIPGHRFGEARNEWEPLAELARRLRPERAKGLAYGDAQAIRNEIARAVPFYAGIERLRETGDQVQYGGRLLCADGRFETEDQRARFAVVRPRSVARAPGQLLLTTRRGKQFNSIVHAERDPLTGAARHDILLARADAERAGLADGDALVLRSPHGAFRGRARIVPIKEGNAQGFWPEVNTLLAHDRFDPVSGVPDYGTIVTVERADERADEPDGNATEGR
ncbi:MAG: FdhF/YdeP family oxidoreductase [Candidatus Eiseniibacteriota bacterium]